MTLPSQSGKRVNLVNWVCMVNALNHHCCNSLLWLATSSCFEAYGVQRFCSQEVCAWDQFCILPRMKKSMALFHIRIFHVILHYFQKENFSMWVLRRSQAGHIWIALWVKGSTGVTQFQHCYLAIS